MCCFPGRILIAVTAILGLIGLASAQNTSSYPNRLICVIVPFAPAGASDFVARVIQRKLSAVLGQQIVIENRAGAAGNIGMDAAAGSAPDGYTLFLGIVGTGGLNPFV